MPGDGNDSDVSAITFSNDEAAPAAKPARAPPAQPAAAARVAEPGGEAAGGGGKKRKNRKGEWRVAFQLPDEDADGRRGRDDDGHVPDWKPRPRASDDVAEKKDEAKALGWSYCHKRDPGAGPVTWEEVDTGELKFVAESLVRRTTTRAASQADAVTAQIFQSAPGEDDTLVPDPLGRGVIDPFSLTMGKRSKMARQVLPNQEGFEPEAYLAAFHGDSSRSQLEKGLRSLSRELSERTGQLKLLIRNNFDRIINCKDAMDDIHAKLRKMLVRGQGAQQAVGTDRVFRSLEQVENNARHTFGPILDRAATADRIRAVVGLLQRQSAIGVIQGSHSGLGSGRLPPH